MFDRRIRGEWYDGATSRRHAAWLDWDEHGRLIVRNVEKGDVLVWDTISGWRISPRVGNTTRFLAHRKGGRFVTTEQDAVDTLQGSFQPSVLTCVVHRMETHKRFIALALAVMLVFAWGVVFRGIPALSRVLAEQVPGGVLEQVARETLLVCDRSWLTPSQLDPLEKARLRDHFAPIIADHPNLALKILFRGGGPLEANAVALPDGTVVMLDELVRLAEDDLELTAILLHEIGHVEHRHGLRMLIQGSVLAMGLAFLTGDTSATLEAVLGAPLAINELSYSRRFEFEADDYARDYMLANGIPLKHFHDILQRLDRGDPSGPLSFYLSTHPSTFKRIERFQPQ